ncbi:MAG: 2-amino-4-hydroxy-6-hydroxymethyldihydropteridine diphosphokinase [Planctomycetota bacterium]
MPSTSENIEPAVSAIALGANLGDPSAAVTDAFGAIAGVPGVDLLARSSLFETAPVGGPPNQPSYINAAVIVRCAVEARALLDALQAIERNRGRDRANEKRWGPRVLDLDLLVHGDAVIDEPGLCVPHPRLAERLFVLEPLAEIAPDLVVPGRGRVVELLEALRCDS